MPNFKESGALYLTPPVIGQDYNVVTGVAYAAPNCAAMACNVHRGNEKAAYEVSALGHRPNQASYAYFDPTYAPWLQSGRSVFFASTGESFRIMGVPSVRTRNPRTAHVRCLLNLYSKVPTGIPSLYFETTYVSAVGKPAGTDTYIP